MDDEASRRHRLEDSGWSAVQRLHVILRHGAVRLTGAVLTLALAVWNLAIFAARGHHFVNLGGEVCLAVAGALYLSAFTRARRERQRQDSA